MKRESKEIIATIRWMLVLAGIWPNKNPSMFYLTRRYISLFFSVGLYIINILEAIKVYDDYIAMAELLYVMMSVTSYIFKVQAFLSKNDTVWQIIEDIDSEMFNMDFEARNKIVESYTNLITTMAKTYQVLAALSVTFFSVYPVYANKPLPVRFSYNLGQFRPLMYAFQIGGLAATGWVNISLDLLCTALMAMTSVQLDTLKHRLEDGPTELEKETGELTVVQQEKHLVQCVEYHIKIIRFVDNINEVFSLAILVFLLGGMLVMCNSLFQVFIVFSTTVAISQFVQLLTYFLVIVIEISLYCWFGNDIILKSLEITDACYKTRWYDFNKNSKTILIMIMERAKRPMNVTAHKFAAVSLVVLMTILRWSYSAFALLKRVYSTK